eukprot:GHVS01086189.1.p1 GENE.GHVS01086189.1~~GHVS01086189.1.p1  ORF type:complete len:187 (+),score=18.11 GHVS01086189.1:32-592(+)
MRLTVELIQSAPQAINPTNDRMISMRGCKIAIIENLGGTKDHFDCIDLTDNEILKLDNIPPLKRLKTFIVANNRISRLAPDMMDCIPNLTSLVLTNNRLELLYDLVPLFKAKYLTRLVLADNPVASKEHYRLALVYKMPGLRYIDFKRVTEKERTNAKRLFQSESGSKYFSTLVEQKRKPTVVESQ